MLSIMPLCSLIILVMSSSESVNLSENLTYDVLDRALDRALTLARAMLASPWGELHHRCSPAESFSIVINDNHGRFRRKPDIQKGGGGQVLFDERSDRGIGRMARP